MSAKGAEGCLSGVSGTCTCVGTQKAPRVFTCLDEQFALGRANREAHRTKYTPTYISCIYMQTSCCQHIISYGCQQQKRAQMLGRARDVSNIMFSFSPVTNNHEPFLFCVITNRVKKKLQTAIFMFVLCSIFS